MKTTTYCRKLRCGIIYDFNDKEGSGVNARLPVWEALVLITVVPVLLIGWAIDLLIGRE